MSKIWIRTPLGLENFTVNTLKECIEISDLNVQHRSIVFKTDSFNMENAYMQLKNVRSIDDAYFFIGECSNIDHTKSSISFLVDTLGKELVSYINTHYDKRKLRTTVSFLGKRNYNRYYVEELINSYILKNCNVEILSNEQKEAWVKGEVRLRCHIESEFAFMGFGIRDIPLHRRSWRSEKYDGQLHTPVAGAMAKLLNEKVGTKQIIDPFCGSGTLIIESSLMNRKSDHLGFDINSQAIKIAKNAGEEAQISANFLNEELNLNDYEDKSFCILSNPPWDNKHFFSKKNKKAFIKRLCKIVQKSVYSVLIIPDEIITALRIRDIKVNEMFRTRIRGKIVSIVTIN